MKKLHSLAFYALVTPAIALSSGAVLAEQSADKDADQKLQNTQQDQDATKATTGTAQTDQKTGDQSGMKNQGYLDSAPPNGMQASELIGTDLKTSGEESVGEIGDLIIDQDGQVVAVVVSVGGFLGMGEKHVAIDWNKVQMSSNQDDRDLRVDVTRDELESAPGFEKQDN